MKPNPAEFEDFRLYLREMVKHLKQMDASFSYREFSRRAGFSSPSALKLVIDGKRNIAHESLGRFAEGLQLNRREREIFELLVQFGQAKANSERNHYYLQLRKLAQQTRRAPVPMGLTQYDVYSLWYAIPVRELMLVPGFRSDPAWIGQQFQPALEPDQVQQAIDLLVEVGLATVNDNGEVESAEPTISADPERPPLSFSLGVQNFHRHMLDRSKDALDELPPAKRNITSVTVSLSRAQYEVVCDGIAQLRRRVLALSEHNEGTGAEAVYHLGAQLFPLTEHIGEGDSEPPSDAPTDADADADAV